MNIFINTVENSDPCTMFYLLKNILNYLAKKGINKLLSIPSRTEIFFSKRNLFFRFNIFVRLIFNTKSVLLKILKVIA